MDNTIRLEENIRTKLEDYKRIALYGTGNGAEKFISVFEKMDMDINIIAVIDRDDSEIIGKFFHGYQVVEFREIMEDVEAIVIVSPLYWKSIEKRLDLLMRKYQVRIQVISIYDYTSRKNKRNTLEDYREYVQYIEDRYFFRNDQFVPMPKAPYERSNKDSKIIAWYLPQYYPIESNDKFHGKGFTEWTNSSRAVPLFVGHDQPHVPYDVGYYTLDNPRVMERQIFLAKWFGIYGFCFHYYWFSGKRTMEVPLYMLLEHKELDIPFCLNWATENWTCTWDGSTDGMIYEQRIEDGDDEKFMKDILPFFHDPRYIRIEGKPLLIIYSLEIFGKECSIKLLDSFRRIAKANGFIDLYILVSNHGEFDKDVQEYGADGLVEFPPTFMSRGCHEYMPEGYVNPCFSGKIYSMKEFVHEKKYMRQYHSKTYYRSALVSFDNTARKTRWGNMIWQGASPELFGTWLFDILTESKLIHDDEHDYVFINSWNEWAEGSHLEPDTRKGYAYLESTVNALYRARGLTTNYIENEIQKVTENGQIPHFYILCIESMGDIVACEPIARFLKEECPYSKVTWIVKRQYTEIVENNPYIDIIKKIDALSDAIEFCENVKAESNAIIVDCHYNGRWCTKNGIVHRNQINPQINERTYFHYGSLLENFSLTAGLKALDVPPIFYERKAVKNPFADRKYVVMHCRSAEKDKDWQTSKWKILAQKIMDMGYKVIEIGFMPVLNFQSEDFIDYTGKKDLQVLAQIIKDSHSFIGVDSGFAHIANCFSKKSVILMGKYKNFIRPMPYTGYFREQQDKMIIYSAKGAARNITVEEVMKKWMQLFELTE